MPGDTRVPKKDSLFDPYIRNTTKVLEDGSPTGAIRLGITPTQATSWIAYRDAWILLYPKYTDPAQRTKAITIAKNTMKADFAAFAKTPLLLIEASANLTAEDRLTFRLPVRDAVNTARAAVGEVPFGSLKGKGGCIMEARVRREHDATRASMHKLADVVEFRYIILDASVEAPTPGPVPPPAPPKNIPLPEDMPFTISSKKALWQFNLPSAALGKRILGFFRWVNFTDPTKSSGWSDIATTIIS